MFILLHTKMPGKIDIFLSFVWSYLILRYNTCDLLKNVTPLDQMISIQTPERVQSTFAKKMMNS